MRTPLQMYVEALITGLKQSAKMLTASFFYKGFISELAMVQLGLCDERFSGNHGMMIVEI